MISFVYTNETVFCLTMTAYLFSAILATICFSMGISYRLKPQYVFPELSFAIISISFFCYLTDGIKIRYFKEKPDDFIGSACFWPSWIIILIAIGLSALTILWIVLIVKKRISSITAMSVKEAVSELPKGLCFYDDTGRLLLINTRIEEDVEKLTDESLYDGNDFWSAIKENILSNGTSTKQSNNLYIVHQNDGIVMQFRKIDHSFDGKRVYELSATDITLEHSVKKEIEDKNEKLKKLNMRLREYSKTVTQVIKEKEILAARIRVHNQLGSLILQTEKELMQKDPDHDSLISSWNELLSMLFLPMDESQDPFAQAEKTAADIGVNIKYEGDYPKKRSMAEKIFASAIFECATNTVRHADGTELYVTMRNDKGYNSIEIRNNGNIPKREIKEGGGLSSLRKMSENAGGTMSIQTIPSFSLMINIPKEPHDER